MMLAGPLGARFDFLLGTPVINVAGCLLFRFLTTLALQHAVPPDARLILGTRFCGAFTTFSTFELEADEILRRAPNLALWGLSGALMLGFAGRWLAPQIMERVAA